MNEGLHTILVLVQFPDGSESRIPEAAGDYTVTFSSLQELTQEMVDGAEVIIGNVPVRFLHAQESLKCLMLQSSGADEYVRPGVLAPGTILTCGTGAYSLAVAEHALALTLQLLKKLYLYRDDQLHHKWADEGAVTSLSEATVLIVGLGDIGTQYAKMVKSLGAYVIGVRRRVGDCPEYVDEVYTSEALPELLPRADVVFSILPGTRDTLRLFDADTISHMKSSAVFINCGRGSSVDTRALCDALEAGRLRAAAVDVLAEEPLAPDFYAWDVKNLVITPHVAGFFHHHSVPDRLIKLLTDNLKAYISGEKLANLVDFDTGYRK